MTFNGPSLNLSSKKLASDTIFDVHQFVADGRREILLVAVNPFDNVMERSHSF
jgi:hypothetical protein